MTPAQRQILRLERRQVADFNRRDLKAVVQQFAPGFVGFSSTRHKRIAGRTALKKTFQHYLRQSPRVRYNISQPRVQLFGATAVASFYWTVALTPRRRVHGRGTHVFVKRGRQWQVVHEHFSRLP